MTTPSSLRGAVDQTEAQIVLLLLIVDVETSCDLVLEVVVDLAGVVSDLDLPHPGDPQQHVLIVNEGLASAVQRPVVVPSRPVEAIQ